jgi:hypothetical protein
MQKSCKSNIPVTKEAAAGAAIYSKFLLTLYDIEVLMFEMPYIFKCPLRKVMKFYNENITGNHLDVGVGTGYFLDKCKFPVENPTIHLMDLNSNSLDKTSERIKRYNPVLHQWNILEPINKEIPVFNSISASNFLHCLPGTMIEKEILFKNLNPYLCEGGVFFGTTVLGQGVEAGFLYKKMNSIYNKSAIFCNLNDNMVDLETILANNFRRYSVKLIGSIALFRGIK